MSVAAPTVVGLARDWAHKCPDRVWMKERSGDDRRQWTWQESLAQSDAVAAWLQAELGEKGTRIAILSRNRPHWFMADLAIAAAGHVSVPLFTTLTADIGQYILEFSEARMLILGEAENWERLRDIVPDHVRIVTLPGIEAPPGSVAWEDIVAEHAGKRPEHECRSGDLYTIVFTSGTTGKPKGVMQTHTSMILPMQRTVKTVPSRLHPRFLSYLPLSHIAERQIVYVQSLIQGAQVSFNEDLGTLVRDMSETRPNLFFGAPRVWEMLRQGVVGKFGGPDAFERAFAADPAGVSEKVRTALGFTDYDYLLCGAAPIPTTLLKWYQQLGICVVEGFGQTEAMSLVLNTPDRNRTGSVGQPLDGVELRLSEQGELLCKADGLSPGYYKQPQKTAETFVDGWVHTGDKARIDADGFVFLTGRVADYFKTLHGKFVAPVPIEDQFAANPDVEQLCLLGRGLAKTVMVCVLSAAAQQKPAADVETSLRASAEALNQAVEKHARIGVIIVSNTPWTIENGLLTPTLKIKRDAVESRLGRDAPALATKAAESGQILVVNV
ncbi:MAG: AMP-binding protein [Panacagrimonas sp.]